MQLDVLATPAPEVLVILVPAAVSIPDRVEGFILAPVAVSILVPAAVFILVRAAACIPVREEACTQDRGAASMMAPAAAFIRDRPQKIRTRIMVRSVPASQVPRTIVG
ncbi:hypothetical protein AF336_16035 [Bradyrhizobium diazoefficiens]|nr:hypothetical protein BD122_23710 [Bradyrhizobium diazoefficiens]KOY09466.1 hypothetical protein AF336_16035 [Bradyrhizobium diazoefficiens]